MKCRWLCCGKHMCASVCVCVCVCVCICIFGCVLVWATCACVSFSICLNLFAASLTVNNCLPREAGFGVFSFFLSFSSVWWRGLNGTSKCFRWNVGSRVLLHLREWLSGWVTLNTTSGARDQQVLSRCVTSHRRFVCRERDLFLTRQFNYFKAVQSFVTAQGRRVLTLLLWKME